MKLRDLFESDDKNIINEIYAHISNSGYTFKIADNGMGPELIIEYGSFGITSSRTEVTMDADSLKMLGAMLIETADLVKPPTGSIDNAEVKTNDFKFKETSSILDYDELNKIKDRKKITRVSTINSSKD